MKRAWGEHFQVGPHHAVIERFVEDVFDGKITRGIINIPPGFSKTMLITIMLVARGLARFPDARFIHASFSDMLVQDNSTFIRDVINTPEYQALWPREIKKDVNKKGLWRTTQQGGLLAKPANGPITGFRAGRLDKKRFTGALIIDDPLKPDDSFSKVVREQVNRNFNTTLRNRLMHPGVPIIIIMQRLHDNDLCGFLLKGGSGDYWDHLLLPVEIKKGAKYPKEYSHGIPYDHGLPEGMLWNEKVDEAEWAKVQTAEYVAAAQYMQAPNAAGGTVFKRDHLRYWKTYEEIPNIVFRIIYADTAQKTEEQHDYSVFQCWGKGVDGKVYLLDQLRGKWTAPDLQENAEQFWRKHRDPKAFPPVRWGGLRSMKIEDKVSGTTLLQSMKGIPVLPIERHKDKYTRALDTAPAFKNGLVVIPFEAPWLLNYEAELLGFPGADHDDCVDPTMDAVADMVGVGLSLLEVL